MNVGTLITPRSDDRSMHTVDLGNGYGMRVLDIPGLGSFDLISGEGSYASAKSYVKSPWAFACMQIRGSELANLPWRLTRNGVIVESHPLRTMIMEFGAESNYAEGMQATEIDMLMLGKAFWLRDIDQLRRLNAHTMTVKSDQSGITEFVQTIRGKVANRFSRDEVVYFREYHPTMDLGPGIPVLDVVKGAVAIEYEAGLYAEAFFKNDATPSLLLSTEQPVTEPQMDMIKAWWTKTFQGARKAHQVGFADRGIKAQILSTSMKDIALTTVRDQARNDICAGMRVPKILVGAMEEATYANAQEARKFMLEDVIIPRSTYFADVINADLIRKVDPSLRFEFVPQDLQILQEGANDKWKRLSDAVDRGAISLPFARAQMGWPETAAPVAAPSPVAGQAERIAWRRKVTKALQAGRSAADVPFDCYATPDAVQGAIRAQLAGAGIDDLARIFGDGS